VLRAQGGQLLDGAKAINVLRSTGSPQEDAPGRPSSQRIGTRPNLRQLIPKVANVWQHNMQVVRTHAKVGSRQAWALFSGTSWLRIRGEATDGVSNVFDILCEALANSRRVDILVQDGQVTQVTLR
jgi:hypothetical protein